MHPAKKGLIGLVMLCFPAISYGQDGAVWRFRPALPQQEIQEMMQEAREKMQVQIEEARIKSYEMQQQMREQMQVQQERVHNELNERNVRWRIKQRNNERLIIERNRTRSDGRSSSPRLDQDDPFLKEMRDEQHQLRESSVPNVLNRPTLPSAPFTLGLPDARIIPMPSLEMDQYRSQLEVMRPEFEKLRDNIIPFREQMEAFKEHFEIDVFTPYDMPLQLSP